MFVLELNNCDLYTLDVAGRGSETQLQEGEKLNYLT